MRYQVKIVKLEDSYTLVEIEARSYEDACKKANEQKNNLEYIPYVSQYEIQGIVELK